MVAVWSLIVVSIVATTTVNGLSLPGGGDEKTKTGWMDRHETGWMNSHENGCSSRHLCCQGKNNTCRVDGPRVSNSDSFTCFCDSACAELGDCCVDYKTTCRRQLPVQHNLL